MSSVTANQAIRRAASGNNSASALGIGRQNNLSIVVRIDESNMAAPGT
jgi:hypothetical protein